MKIENITHNNKKKSFEINTKDKTFFFPYSKLNLKPLNNNPITEVYIDKDFGSEGFTYKLKSGVEATVPMDAVLEYNKDPKILRETLLYKITLDALKIIKESKVSNKEIIRRMKCSETQFYRIIKTNNYNKTLDQMVKLLEALDYEMNYNLKKISNF